MVYGCKLATVTVTHLFSAATKPQKWDISQTNCTTSREISPEFKFVKGLCLNQQIDLLAATVLHNNVKEHFHVNWPIGFRQRTNNKQTGRIVAGKKRRMAVTNSDLVSVSPSLESVLRKHVSLSTSLVVRSFPFYLIQPASSFHRRWGANWSPVHTNSTTPTPIQQDRIHSQQHLVSCVRVV